MTHHGLKEPAGLDFVPHSRFHHGRFGRLFRNLDPVSHSDAALSALADVMVDPQAPAPSGGGWQTQPPDPGQGDNPEIPAGYTYLGQFIDHDVTFDPASSLQRANDPNALHNFRTPRFDLDSIYGEGTADEPFLYERDSDGRLLLGRVGEGEELDLPRNAEGVALIGDPRNDENVVVSQLQLLFLRAHNKLHEPVGGFDEARRQLRWHYQYLVVHDFLARIVGPDLVREILDPETPLRDVELQFFGWEELPYMPVEFSVAAYRFGHSMVRPIYDLNGTIRDKPIFDAAGGPGAGQDLRGFQPLLSGWSADWSFFFQMTDARPQASRLIDTRLAPGLASLPFARDEARLAMRNLLRGRALGLPSGEAVARRMGLDPLSEEQLGLEGLGLAEEVRNELRGKTPLWVYVLREAEVQTGGLRLGQVGGRIVAETLIGLLHGDPFSFLNIDPAWTPARAGLIPQSGGNIEFADLIRFVQT